METIALAAVVIGVFAAGLLTGRSFMVPQVRVELKVEESILNKFKEMLMTVSERIEGVLARIDTATNNIAADLRGLKEKLANEGVDAAHLASLEDAATRLEGVAASTEDPVPGDGGGPATTPADTTAPAPDGK